MKLLTVKMVIMSVLAISVVINLSKLNLAQADAPKNVMAFLNINADDKDAGPEGRAIGMVDLDKDKEFYFPFTTIEGGPIAGQPVHIVFSSDKARVYVTMSGNDKLPLRLLVGDVTWNDAQVPTVKIIKTVEDLPAKSKDKSNAYCCRPKGTKIDPFVQEGHGTNKSDDDKWVYFSELHNNRLRVFDTTKLEFVAVGTNPSLKGPHGLYPNPSGTLGASTQYQINGDEVTTWTMDAATGQIKHKDTIKLKDTAKKMGGAYTHTIRWINDTQFYTNVTQEANQGVKGKSEASVWLVDTAKKTATAVLRKAKAAD
ncbi:MAG: hypothetical protein AABZ55_05225, partial [Bdellovibrionota bacterium]